MGEAGKTVGVKLGNANNSRTSNFCAVREGLAREQDVTSSMSTE